MTKRISCFALFIPIVFLLASCGTTENVAQTPAEAVTQTQEDVANAIADELNARADTDAPARAEEPPTESENTVQAEEPTDATSEAETANESLSTENVAAITDTVISTTNEVPSSQNEETPAEKVSDEDSNLDRARAHAPTTDERGKVSEYPIFEEPEVVVLDLPEPEPKQEELPVQEPIPEEVPPTASVETPAHTESTPPLAEAPAPEAAAQPPVETPAEQNTAVATVLPTENTSDATAKDEQATPTQEAEAEESAPIVPSRSVAVKINQYLDVTYPGKGWTYIGETEKQGLFNYFGRKLGTSNTTFSLRAKKAGNTILHFYKNDALTGEYIDDYLAVTVEAKKSAGRVKAPAYADIVPAKPQRRIDRAQETLAQNAKEQQAQTASSTESSAQSANETKTSSKNATTASKASSQNQTANPTEAEQSKPSQTPTARTNQGATPLTNTESDIKTVIQTTDGAADTALSAASTPSLTIPSSSAQSSSNEQSVQATQYTPTSSQSEPVAAQTETIIQSDPWVTDTVQDDATATTATVDESLLEKAKQDFVDGKFADALKEAQEYYNNASTRLDEALFLLGQISESNSSVKDIRFAVDSYDMLVKRFPASKLWKDAKNRSIYLKRFYIDIR